MKVNVLNSGNLRVNKPEKISYYIEAYISLGGKKHTKKNMMKFLKTMTSPGVPFLQEGGSNLNLQLLLFPEMLDSGADFLEKFGKKQ